LRRTHAPTLLFCFVCFFFVSCASLDTGINLLDQSVDVTVKTIQVKVKPLQDKVQETAAPTFTTAVNKLNQIQLGIDLNKPKRYEKKKTAGKKKKEKKRIKEPFGRSCSPAFSLNFYSHTG
jgi:hypothetical protein